MMLTLSHEWFDRALTEIFSKEARRKIMSSIRGKNTKPELTIRKMLWASGKRYRIHDKTVFGIPDISSKKKKVAIFIDGCFWHGCKKCYKEPETNAEFWRKKISSNRSRRVTVLSILESEGWKVMQFWEHEINRHPKIVINRIRRVI